MAARAWVFVVLANAAWLAAAPVLRAQGNPGEAFKARLLAALDSGSPQQVAALVQYPIRVNHAMLPYPIPVDNAAAMARLYKEFFTPQLRCAIEASRLPRGGQPPPRYPMHVADGVVTLGNGLIVAQQTPRGFRITRLSVIGQAPGAAAKPRDVLFRWGEGETQFAGRLATGGVDGYIIHARKGGLLQARIERFPGRSLQLRVTDEAGAIIKGASTEFSRIWAARVPAAGKYRLDVVRHGTYCDPDVTYLLTVGVRH